LLSHFAWETITTVSCIHIKLAVNHSNHEEDSNSLIWLWLGTWHVRDKITYFPFLLMIFFFNHY
jgi:hypothetical protein